jgi:dUTP pyrophosphatase
MARSHYPGSEIWHNKGIEPAPLAMRHLELKIILLSPHAKIPIRSTSGAAGYDLFASADKIVPGSSTTGRKVRIGRSLISTGIAIVIPNGYLGKIGSRSGLSIVNNIEVGAGWIDPDYRGEILVELKNLGADALPIKQGDRVAQLFLIPVAHSKMRVVQSIPPTRRGSRGFGSTGSK